mmetsp:Transcript_31594/g.30903  ORF Transcript_31594/g.30903 Transcript_31594/m.30903 type:complete len:86 (-) Transcript_31594:1065-1322(-)
MDEQKSFQKKVDYYMKALPDIDMNKFQDTSSAINHDLDSLKKYEKVRNRNRRVLNTNPVQSPRIMKATHVRANTKNSNEISQLSY